MNFLVELVHFDEPWNILKGTIRTAVGTCSLEYMRESTKVDAAVTSNGRDDIFYKMHPVFSTATTVPLLCNENGNRNDLEDVDWCCPECRT